jgi:hypothetical protein
LDLASSYLAKTLIYWKNPGAMGFGKKALEEAIKNVRRDVKDDFWPDIFDYADYLDDPTSITTVNYNAYTPGSVITLDIPKPTLILRPGHFVRLTDRIYYQLLINRFAKKVDAALLEPDIVFSHRLSQNSRYFFENGVEAWKRFNAKTEKLFQKHPGGYLLKTDISAYFEHIQIKKLGDILLQLGASKDTLNKLLFLLNTWHESGIGIPQGLDPSSFLGNVYLHAVDEAMISEKFTYYRFMDDIRIFALEEKELQRAIAKLTELMRPINLHLAGGKTRILNRENYFSSANQFSEEMEAVAYGLDVGLPPEYSLSRLRKLWGVAIKKQDKTILNFCINRFKKLKSEYPLNSILKNNLFDPSYSGVIISYLENFIDRKRVQSLLVTVLEDSSYTYQKILILRMLLKAKKLCFPLKEIDKEKIYQTNNFMLIGYYFILVGKFGNPGLRTSIKNKFTSSYSDDEKIARYFLVAASHLPNYRDEGSQLLRTKKYLVPTARYIDSHRTYSS